MTTVAFFNNTGGVGKTSVVYHLAWMYADLGMSVVAADLDPQANLTSMFLDDREMDELLTLDTPRDTVHGALMPLLRGIGDIEAPTVRTPAPAISLIPGDLALSQAEDDFSSQWPLCLDRNESAFRVITALGRILEKAKTEAEAELIMIDVGPNLGAINRAALIASDFVAVPLSPDLFSLQGLRNLGPALHSWRTGWTDRIAIGKKLEGLSDLSMPSGRMSPVGYMVLQHAVRFDRPVRAYTRWMDAIPGEYCKSVLSEKPHTTLSINNDENHLGTLKHYRSLMAYAQDVRKPMFKLTSADGAVGGHINAVEDCYLDFRALAREISKRCGVTTP